MKQFKLVLVAFTFCIVGVNSNVYAQKSIASIEIETSATIEESKEIVEQSLAVEKGVKQFEFNEESSVIVVEYQENKTTPEKIRLAISKSGFNADDIKADPKAVKLLPKKCKTKCCSPK